MRVLGASALEGKAEVGKRIGGDIGTAGKSLTAVIFECLGTCEGRAAGGPARTSLLTLPRCVGVFSNDLCALGCLLSDRDLMCEGGFGRGHGCG